MAYKGQPTTGQEDKGSCLNCDCTLCRQLANSMDSAAGVASVRANLDGSGISTYILIMLVVPLKIWCRTSGGRAVLGWDDYLSIMALVSANCFFYVCMLGASCP